MDFKMREALRKSRIFLLENVIFEPLCDHLIDQDIFSDSMLDHIKARKESTERIRRMLDHLTKRPDSCFQKFLNALQNSGHEHCAIHVKQNYVRSGATQVSESNQHSHIPLENQSNTRPQPQAAPPSSSMSAQAGSALSSNIPSVNWTSVQNSSSTDKQPQYFGFPEISEASLGASASASFPLSTPVQESTSLEQRPAPGTVLSPRERLEDITSRVERINMNRNGDVLHPYHSEPDKFYRMESNPRGLVLVISNETFESMTDRNGSTADMQNLHDMFKFLGFDVCHQMNKTAVEMKELMEKFAQYEGLRNVDALAVVIMSHGSRGGVIYGKDGRNHGSGNEHTYITDEIIQDIFSARNCPIMANKPKLIIIQACRGRNEDAAPPSDPNVSLPTSSSSNNQPITTDGGSVASGTSSTSSTRSAIMSNMLLIHSTVHGYVSYRHPVMGSPFVRVLTDVIKEKARTDHIMDMMPEVTARLAHMPLQQDLRTIPSVTFLLTKKWYLNPLNLH